MILVLALLGALGAEAAPVKLSLSEAIAHALTNNGELNAERSTIKQAEADVDRVGGEFGPHFEALMGVGPNYASTGNALTSVEDKHHWGRTFLGNISLTEPIYSFGRAANYSTAARAGVAVREAGVKLKEDDVRLQVKEAYYGYLVAKSLVDFVNDERAEIDRVLKDKKLAKTAGYRVDLFYNEIDAKTAELQKMFKLAEEGLQLRLGAREGESFLPKEEWIDTADRKLEPMDYYLSRARQERGEFRQLEQGIKAKRHLVTAERGAFLPVLAVLTRYEFADTNVTTEQNSRFAYDPYNRDTLTFGVGLKWDLQWGLPQAKADKAAAEAEELEAKSAFADRGILTEVKKAYWELEEANTRLEAATSANKTTKKWLSGELLAIGSGLSTPKMDELATAYGARAEAVKNFYQAIYEQHMAWARLSKAVGSEIDPTLH